MLLWQWNGRFVGAMSRPLVDSNGAEHGEAIALLLGVELAAWLGSMPFLVESDSVVMVKKCMEEEEDFSPLGNYVDEFKCRVEHIAFLGLHKIDRKQNCLADILAKHAISLSHVCFWHDLPMLSCMNSTFIEDLG